MNKPLKTSFHHLSDMVEGIKEKQISPVEVTLKALERIQSLDPKLNAFYTVFEDQALTTAKQAEQEILKGFYRGPLHGIPLAVKDIYDWGPTTAGSRLFKDNVAARESAVVTRLKQAGGVLMGKLATFEFAIGAPCLSSFFRATKNPWDTRLSTGGSSSGSAAAVASDMVFGAMGSDTGGSIRHPAFCCGVVGLKPTYGRVSRAGMIPLAWSLDHAGPLTRTVRDSLLLQGCAGYDLRDPSSARVPVPNFSSKLGQDIKGVKIGIPWQFFENSCDKEILSAFDEVVIHMEALGAHMEEVSFPSFQEVWASFFLIMLSEAAAYHGEYMKTRLADYSKGVRLFLTLGKLVRAEAYVQAQRFRVHVRNHLLDQLKSVDLFMTPTVGFMTGPIPEEPPGLPPQLILGDFKFYTPLFNLSGMPAVSVPCGFSSQGLPIGLQLAAAPFKEADLLQAAFVFEQATQWHLKHPPV